MLRFFGLFLLLNAAALAGAIEGFDYTQGSVLGGQNGGSGFSAPWSDAQTALIERIVPGLSYSGLATSPGAALSDAPVSGQVAFYTRQLSQPLGADNTTVFLSVLLRPESGFGFYGGVNLGGLFIGKSGITNTYGIEGPTNDISSTSTIAAAGTTVLLVLRADFLAGNDEFSLYVNPVVGGGIPAVADATKSDLDTGAINFLFVNNAGSWTTDEIRIGDTFASVTTASTPEPATLFVSLLGLAGVSLSSIRAKRRGLLRD